MLASTLSALVLALFSLATVNGVVVQRDGTFPTTLGAAPSTTTTSGTTSTTSTTTTSATSTVRASSSTTAPTTTSTITTRPTTTPTITPTVIISSFTSSSRTFSGTTPTGSIRPTAGAVSCDGVQGWQAAFAYTAGNAVIFNNQLFTAKQWTYDNAPPSHPDQWTLVGTCSQPISNKANCNGVAAWDRNVAYNAGNQVTFNNHLWSAVQWTTANSPGDASGSWQDKGVCA